MNINIITYSKEACGIGIPDFKHYYYATHLTRVVDFHCHQKKIDWIVIENALAKSPLKFLPWIQKSNFSPSLKSHPFIGIFFGNLFQLKMGFHPRPTTPIANNPSFFCLLPCSSDIFFQLFY